ncbi:hypothetical protein K438DRAFT_1776279 [Mycena galopus ATCC 62051]|nr:hypothetical protein K438DRAFT_1776279 [Mycena galopus ATCC 62051]
MTDIERLEVMDSQRFDFSKRRTNNSMNLSIQTGFSDDGSDISLSSGSSSPLSSTLGDSCESLACDSSPETCDSASDSASKPLPPTPPGLLQPFPVTPKAGDSGQLLCPTAVSFVTPRTSIHPILRCFSRPSSPAPSRPSSPLRPSSPINFGALNCFSNADAFTEHVDYLHAQHARELEGRADVEVHVHQVVATDFQVELPPWIVQKVVDPEALRVQRTRDEPRGFVSCP